MLNKLIVVKCYMFEIVYSLNIKIYLSPKLFVYYFRNVVTLKIWFNFEFHILTRVHINDTRGNSDSPIKTAKCSFLRTDMQYGFIKVIRIKRGSSNCKMIVASWNIFCDKYKYNHRSCPMAIRLGLLESGQHFADYFILFPKKFQRLLNTLQTIIKAKRSILLIVF